MGQILKIVAGPNGSGKTTFAESFLIPQKPTLPFLNPDLIAQGFGPADHERSSFRAGRVLLNEIKHGIHSGESFSFESTLSGVGYVSYLKEAKKKGYEIEIYFLFLKKVSMNILRIKKRVEQGGHPIPTKTVRRRHLRCFQNFWKLYRPLCDRWSIFDNSGSSPRLVMSSDHFSKMNFIEQARIESQLNKGRI